MLVVASENLSLPICVLGAFAFFIRASFLAFNFPNVFSKTCYIMVHYQSLMENFMTNFWIKNDYLLCEDTFAKLDVVTFKWSLISSRLLL